MLHQLQAKNEALGRLQPNPLGVKNSSLIPCTFPDDDFTAFGKYTTCIGSKLLKKMGYQGKGLDINGQGIMNSIKVEEIPRHTGLGYVRKDIGESSKAASDQSIMYDETSSSYSNDSTGSMNPYQRNTKGKSFKKRKKNHCSHCNEEGHQESTCQMLHK